MKIIDYHYFQFLLRFLPTKLSKFVRSTSSSLFIIVIGAINFLMKLKLAFSSGALFKVFLNINFW